MNRSRKQKIKQELGATSSNVKEEHDLAYYIHDRVELMHQVFSMIKPKELKAMAPSCVQHISIDNLQELCTEELLGISSKRLCAILDGAEPPTDTESSSSEQLEPISLDSISSDDDVLSEPTTKKKHRHRKKHKSKARHRHKHSSDSDNHNDKGNKSKATRAGLTVLELLELQARARAIRAQLLKDNAGRVEGAEPERSNSSDEVEIKEEPPEVLEISSDDEKPRIEDLEKNIAKNPTNSSVQPSTSSEITEKRSQTVTKVVNDLIITVPAKSTKKIKLNRNIFVRNKNITSVPETKDQVKGTEKEVKQDKKEVKDKTKKKRKKKNKDGSDHDEITLQLSDTEKMDLLEDLDRKNFDNFTSSDASYSDESEGRDVKDKESNMENIVEKDESSKVNVANKDKITVEAVKVSEDNSDDNNKNVTEVVDTIKDSAELNKNTDNTNEQLEDGEITSNKDLSDGEITENEREIVCISDDESKSPKKKKKKEKKSKKEKSDRESSDRTSKENRIDDIDDIYEVLELSDTDYEVDITVSQEPTAEEIKALSARVDEKTSEKEIDNISWRDRYLDSKKVKRVLTTANLLNAMRKKNRELKTKLASKPEKEEESADAMEGTVEEFNTLQGSTKYVDPVQEKDVTKEMKKDAKQLLKMYKMLLKHNDTKQRDSSRKKKKKKSKDKKAVES